MGKVMERSRGRGEVDNDRNLKILLAVRVAPVKDYGSLGAWIEEKVEGNKRGRGGSLIGVANRDFRVLYVED